MDLPMPLLQCCRIISCKGPASTTASLCSETGDESRCFSSQQPSHQIQRDLAARKPPPDEPAASGESPGENASSRPLTLASFLPLFSHACAVALACPCGIWYDKTGARPLAGASPNTILLTSSARTPLEHGIRQRLHPACQERHNGSDGVEQTWGGVQKGGYR